MYDVSAEGINYLWKVTYQKSTFGANRRLMKYSSFMAASCRAMAVSRSSSFPVLGDDHQLIQEIKRAVKNLHFEDFIGSFANDERTRIRL
jgi:hypothetical protein